MDVKYDSTAVKRGSEADLEDDAKRQKQEQEQEQELDSDAQARKRDSLSQPPAASSQASGANKVDDQNTPGPSTPKVTGSPVEAPSASAKKQTFDNLKGITSNWDYLRTRWSPDIISRLRQVANGYCFTSNLRVFVDMPWQETADRLTEAVFNRLCQVGTERAPSFKLLAIDAMRAKARRSRPVVFITDEQLRGKGLFRDAFGLPVSLSGQEIRLRPDMSSMAQGSQMQAVPVPTPVGGAQVKAQAYIPTSNNVHALPVSAGGRYEIKPTQDHQHVPVPANTVYTSPSTLVGNPYPGVQMTSNNIPTPTNPMPNGYPGVPVASHNIPTPMNPMPNVHPRMPVANNKHIPPTKPIANQEKPAIFHIKPKWSFQIMQDDIKTARIIDLLDLHGLHPNPQYAIVADGVMTLNSCCEHWSKQYIKGEPSLKEMAEQEALVYEFHGRGDQPMDRLWAMQFAVTQQAARMDVVLYLLNMLFRHDGQFKLFSFPEPAVFSWQGKDRERARVHGDPYDFYGVGEAPKHSSHPMWFGVLVPSDDDRLASPRGVSFPQGQAKAVWDSVQQSGILQKYKREQDISLADVGSSTQWLDVQTTDAADLSVTGFHTLTPIIISNPMEKMLYYPLRYMTKNAAGTDLEIPGLGGIEALRISNETLTSPRYLSSGQPLSHRITTPWEPSVRVLPSSAISAALLGLMPWEQTAVSVELNDLFMGNIDDAKRLLNRMQKEMHRQTLRAFKEFRRAEMHCFGDQSAFRHIEMQKKQDAYAQPQPQPQPTVQDVEVMDVKIKPTKPIILSPDIKIKIEDADME